MYVSRLTLVFHPPPHLTATRSARTSTTARHTCAAGARPGATASCTRTVRRRSSTWVHSSCSTAHAHTTILVANYEVMIAQDIENWFSFWLLAYYLQDGDIDYTMMGRDVCMGDHKVPSALSVTSLARRMFDVKNIHVPPTAYNVHNTYRVTCTCTCTCTWEQARNVDWMTSTEKTRYMYCKHERLMQYRITASMAAVTLCSDN